MAEPAGVSPAFEWLRIGRGGEDVEPGRPWKPPIVLAVDVFPSDELPHRLCVFALCELHFREARGKQPEVQVVEQICNLGSVAGSREEVRPVAPPFFKNRRVARRKVAGEEGDVIPLFVLAELLHRADIGALLLLRDRVRDVAPSGGRPREIVPIWRDELPHLAHPFFGLRVLLLGGNVIERFGVVVRRDDQVLQIEVVAHPLPLLVGAAGTVHRHVLSIEKVRQRLRVRDHRLPHP